RCSVYDLHRYASRLSGPLLDRIDLYVQAERLTAGELTGPADAEPTAQVRARVLAARDVQRRRQGGENGRLAAPDLAVHCQVTPAARRTLLAAVDRLRPHPRGVHRAPPPPRPPWIASASAPAGSTAPSASPGRSPTSPPPTGSRTTTSRRPSASATSRSSATARRSSYEPGGSPARHPRWTGGP